ncbi:uncharacterized protein METZ01_LOCUS349817, partial [marine metagenome]
FSKLLYFMIFLFFMGTKKNKKKKLVSTKGKNSGRESR